MNWVNRPACGARVGRTAPGTAAALGSVALLVTCRYAALVSDRIGRQGVLIILRLSAFIALCIGAQIAWNGTKALLTEIGVP